jgi:hypothetical protein
MNLIRSAAMPGRKENHRRKTETHFKSIWSAVLLKARLVRFAGNLRIGDPPEA